jgi:hypothetical protein
VRNEHLKLLRALFHALSLGAFGVSLFAPDVEAGFRAVAFAGACYAHFIAHRAVSYDNLARHEAR